MPTFPNQNTNIIILHPIPVEYNAATGFVENLTEKIIEGTSYGIGDFKGQHQNFTIVLCQTGSKNSVIARAAEKAIHLFKPAAALVVGIAGGVKDVNIGDIVIGTKAYGYESGKETAEGFVSRPEVANHSLELLAIAENVKRKAIWKKRSHADASSSQAFFGPIASGDKVIASTKEYVYPLLKKYYNDTLALEMEAIGFGKTMLHHPHIRGLNIRGISDLLDNKSKTDTAGSQELAANHAAAFAFELIYNLDISQFKVSTMDIKTMAEMVFSTLLPFIKESTSIKQISSDISAATNNTVSSIWEIIKPIFIEEFEEENGQLAEGVKEKTTVTHVLNKVLKKEKGMKKDLEALMTVLELKKVREKHILTEVKVKAKNSIKIGDKTVGGDEHWDRKGIIEGGEFETDGDFHLGDG